MYKFGFKEILFYQAIAEICKVFDQSLALQSYSPFLRLLGESTMERCLSNHLLIRKLCQQEYEDTKSSLGDYRWNTEQTDAPTLKINIPHRQEMRWSGSSADASGGKIIIKIIIMFYNICFKLHAYFEKVIEDTSFTCKL